MSWKSRSFSGKRPANSLLSVCQTWTKFDKLIHVDGKVSRYDIFADIIQEEQTVEESRWLFFSFQPGCVCAFRATRSAGLDESTWLFRSYVLRFWFARSKNESFGISVSGGCVSFCF